MDVKNAEGSLGNGRGPRQVKYGVEAGEPPQEVMSKLQHQLEKVQRDIQAQQRDTRRPSANRFRLDTRKTSESDRQGRFSSSGFRPYYRQGLLPRAPNPATSPGWRQQGDPSVRLQGWHGNRLPRMPQLRPNYWQGDRMPQPNITQRHGSVTELPGDFHFGPGINPALSENQQQTFPPLLNPHTDQHNIFGQMGRSSISDIRPGQNFWQRPFPRQFAPPPTVGRGQKPAFNSSEHMPPWQRAQSDDSSTAMPSSCQQPMDVSEQNNSHTQKSDNEPNPQGNIISGKTDLHKDNACKSSDEQILSKNELNDSPTEKASSPPGIQLVPGNEDSCSPPRKSRSSSGPHTPPGLKQDVSFDFTTLRKENYAWHNLFLADLSSPLAVGKKDVGNLFGDTVGYCKNKSRLVQLETYKGNEMREENSIDTKKFVSHFLPFTSLNKDKYRITGVESQDKVISLSFAGDIKGPRYLEAIDEKSSVAFLTEDSKNNLKDLIEPLKILQRDANNNLYDKPDANIRDTMGQNEKSLVDHASLRLVENPSHNVEANNTLESPSITFASPFQYAAYQTKSGGMTRRRDMKLSNGITMRDTSCSKCHERLRWPHLLVCCHRLCFPCLVSIYDSGEQKIQCPYCRSITRTDKSLSSLVLDLHRCREMCSFQISPFDCTVCKEKKHADIVCKTCPGFLCSDCQAKHSQDIELSPHELGPVQSVGYNEHGELHPMCSEHPGWLFSEFCIRCSTMVCSQCLQQKHADHDTCDLSSGKRIAEGRFREMNCGLMDMIELCQKKLQNFNLSKQKVEASMKVVRNNIHKACNQVITYIDSFEKVSKNLTDKVHSAGIKHINGLIKEANETEEARETFHDFCTRYINDSKPDELSAVVPLVHQEVKRLSDFYSKSTLLSPHFSVDLKFDPVYPDFNESMSRMFADLRFEHNVTLESLLKSSLGERAVLETAQLQPYDKISRPMSELGSGSTCSSMETSSGSSGETSSGDDLLQHFIRQTTPCKFIFGKCGRGDYEFVEPSGVCYLHNNCLAVCDAKNHRVIVYDESCNYLKTIGQPTNLPPLPANINSTENEPCFNRTPGTLYFPFRLAQCPVSHNLVVVERPPSTDVQVFTCDGRFVRCFGNDCLKYPRGITVNESGQILVVESRTMKVFIFSMEGTKLHAFYLSMHLEFPNDIAASGGNIFISDNRTHCVHVYDYNLEWQRQIGHESLTYFPIGVAVNHLGHVVVADNHNTFNITVFSQDGSFIHGFKSQSKHANCYSMALHPRRTELAVTTKECRVVLFDYSVPVNMSLSREKPIV
ncbi:hypothetical protein EGW08_012743 [Elysia chlorotica]|uniref:RING-type domain-containing protein n=1 Tax=Elysia chlorotica TaxID=188477 RepID=A0A433TD16_ELYCH|nr:hypothetical protein EGW08_012743 [Elysia chlorotica]